MKQSISPPLSPSLALAFALGISACAGPRAGSPPAATTPSASAPLPFIEDDYPRALAQAKASKKPLFVDGWAPW